MYDLVIVIYQIVYEPRRVSAILVYLVVAFQIKDMDGKVYADRTQTISSLTKEVNIYICEQGKGDFCRELKHNHKIDGGLVDADIIDEQ